LGVEGFGGRLTGVVVAPLDVEVFKAAGFGTRIYDNVNSIGPFLGKCE
jgi:hypothetical protein